MAMIRNIKVMIEDFIFAGDHYYLVRFNLTDLDDAQRSAGLADKMFGTISYDEVDADGKLKRELALSHLFAAKTITEAIKRRRGYYYAQRRIEKLVVEEKLTILTTTPSRGGFPRQKG